MISIEMLICFLKKFVSFLFCIGVKFCFFKIQDGAHAITIGKWGELPEQLAIIGGNCSIHGFNKKSEDVLWTVTGDNVSSLALLDFNSDGYNEVCLFLYFSFRFNCF
jgi:hypothetical protein